jgi:type IV pilus assembly protein PilA
MLTAMYDKGFEFLQEQVHTKNNRRGGNEMNEIVMENKQFEGFKAQKMSFREVMKNEKGLTLIELLAVIVIIAIIAAIAIPSIGSILEKTRINAHRSNAHMAIDAARLYVANEGVTLVGSTATLDLSLTDLNTKGYLELIPKDPSDKPNIYVAGAAAATASPVVAAAANSSFVRVSKDTNGNFQYAITLYGAQAYSNLTIESNIDLDGYVVESGTPTAP